MNKLTTIQKQKLNDLIDRDETVEFQEFIDQLSDVNCDVGGGRNVLHWLAEANRPKLMQIAIQRGCDFSKEDSGGATPLEFATYAGSYEAVQLLLDAGADPLHSFALGSSAIHIAKQLNRSKIQDVLARRSGSDFAR